MEYKTIEEYIAVLSPEEREQHKAIIEECLHRKKLIDQHTGVALESVARLHADLEEMNERLGDLDRSGQILKEATQNLVSTVIPLLKTAASNRPSMN